MWNKKCFVRPVIIYALGIENKGLKYRETIPGQHSTYSLEQNWRTRNSTRSKAYVCGRSVVGVEGSNPSRVWMFVVFYMLCCPA
jgi:hypothetical protein